MPKSEKKTKSPPIRKVPLLMGLIFFVLGLWNVVLLVLSSELIRPTYGTLIIAFFGFGITLLDKSGVFER